MARHESLDTVLVQTYSRMAGPQEEIRELQGGGGSRRWAVALMGGHTTSKNPT